MVSRASWELLITSNVFSQHLDRGDANKSSSDGVRLKVPEAEAPPHLLNTPSTPVTPMPSTMSLDSLKGTVSGVGSVFPCSNATPGSVKKKARQDVGSVSL